MAKIRPSGEDAAQRTVLGMAAHGLCRVVEELPGVIPASVPRCQSSSLGSQCRAVVELPKVIPFEAAQGVLAGFPHLLVEQLDNSRRMLCYKAALSARMI